MKLLFAVAAVLVLLAASMTIQPEQETFGWVLLAALLVLYGLKPFHGLYGRLLFIALGGFISLRYLLFRSFFTLQLDTYLAFVLALLLFAAECYAIGTHFLGLFLNSYPVSRPPAPLPATLPSVDVFIPTYDEAPEVAVTTAIACTNLDYPPELLNIYILDDGCRLPRLNNPRLRDSLWERHTRLKALAEQAGVHYLTREDDVQAKAGMIRAAFFGRAFPDIQEGTDGALHGENPVKTSGELLLILDCDHIPTRDMLKTLVGQFTDPKVFMVQTPHFMLNADPVRKNIRGEERIPCESWLFYQAIMKGLDRWNAAIFCGSAAVLRRTALEDVNGLCGETITEDAETALALHSRGYTSVYVSKPLVAGLAPESVPDMLRQRARWCQGMLQMLLLKNPLLHKGLSLAQRLSYFNCCLYWLFPVFRVIFLLAPLTFLLADLNIYNASTMQVVNFALPHLFGSLLVAAYLYPRLRPFSHDDILELFQTFFLLPAILAVCLSPRRPVFTTTRKGVRLDTDAPSHCAVPLAVMLGLICAGFVLGMVTWHNNPFLHDALAITLVWNALNALFVLCTLGAMFERRQNREAHRFSVDEFATLDGLPGTLCSLSGRGFQIRLADTDAFTTPVGQECRLISGKFSGLVQLVHCDGLTVSGTFAHPVSREVIDFVYGDSARWQRIMDSILQRREPLRIVLMFQLCLTSAGQLIRSLFKRPGRRAVPLVLAALLTTLLGLPSLAAAEPVRIPVSFLTRQDSYVLNEAYGMMRVPVHLSRRATTRSVLLDLLYTTTAGAIPPTLSLTVDGLTTQGRVARLSETAFQIRFAVPEAKLVPGDRVLAVDITQPPSATGIQPVTSLDLRGSTVTVDSDLNELAPDTKDFGLLFDPKVTTPLPLHVVLERLDEAHLLRAIRAVQTIAILLKNRPMSLSASFTTVPDSDNLLIGDTLPSDPASLMPDRRFVLVYEADIIGLNPPQPPNVLRRGTQSSFKDFGLESLLLRPGFTMRNTTFLISSETRLTPNHMLRFSMDVTYGAGFSSDSRLEVYMNGTVLTWLPLRSATGAHHDNYIVEVPTSRLKKGVNVIGVQPYFHPASADVQNREPLYATVSNTSTISLPDTGVYVRLPELATLVTDGYPFRVNTMIHLENPTPAKVSALLHVTAFIAQRRGSISQNPTLSFGPWVGENRNAYVFTVDPAQTADTFMIRETLITRRDQTMALLLSAPTEEALVEGTQRLWQREVLDAIRGEAVVLDLKTGTLTPQEGETVIISDVWPFPALAFYTNNHPLATRWVVGLVLTGFAAVAYVLLKRRRLPFEVQK